MHEENENVSPNQKNQRRWEVTSIQHPARGDSKAIENYVLTLSLVVFSI
jgi:cytosine/uracil/thiamine/allantoin permease